MTMTADQLRGVLEPLAREIGEVNVANGWDASRAMLADPDAYDPRWRTAHKIAELGLIDTEVSEAIEVVRRGYGMREVYYPTSATNQPTFEMDGMTKLHKPEGVPSELADVIIRVLDIADAYGIDIAAAVVEKLAHNRTRGLHHGGKSL